MGEFWRVHESSVAPLCEIHFPSDILPIEVHQL